MNTLHTNSFDVNPISLTQRDVWGEMVARLRTIQQPRSDFADTVVAIKHSTLLSFESEYTAVECDLDGAALFAQASLRFTPQTIDAVWRLGLKRKDIALICGAAAESRDGVIDIAPHLRARVRAGIVMHIYRRRRAPRGIAHARCDR